MLLAFVHMAVGTPGPNVPLKTLYILVLYTGLAKKRTVFENFDNNFTCSDILCKLSKE